MSVTLQVLYPAGNGTSFDYDYYASTHMKLVGEHMGPHIHSTVVTRGIAAGPDTPPGYHAIATIVFADQEALDAAMAKSVPVLADLPNFTDSKAEMLIGQTIG